MQEEGPEFVPFAGGGSRLDGKACTPVKAADGQQSNGQGAAPSGSRQGE